MNSPKKPQFDKDSLTLVGEKLPTLTASIRSQNLPSAGKEVHTGDPVSMEAPIIVRPRIESRRESIKSRAMKAIGYITVGAALGSSGTYKIMSSPTDKKFVSTAQIPMPSSIASSSTLIHKPETPTSELETPTSEITENPITPEMLRASIKEDKISSPKAEQFGNGKFINGLMIDDQMNWSPIQQKDLKNEILIAVKFDKPEYKEWVSYAGIRPTASVEDETNPLMVFHYYQCSQKNRAMARGASIAIKMPGTPKNKNGYLKTIDIILPECKKDTPTQP